MSPDLLLKVLYWHILPSMSALLLTAGFLSLVTKAINVKNPRWEYWLFLVPLVKGFVVLVSGARPWPPIPTDKPFVFGIRLWDPLNLISVPSAFDNLARPPTVADMMVIGALSLLALALVWRWVALFAFYRSIGGVELHHRDAPRLFQMLDTLAHKMHTRYPKITVSDKPYILPCLVGVFRPTIILSPEIAEESSDEVLEATLAHELAHLKRHDNLLHWVLVVLKDALILNPFVYFLFPRILAARERDCDRTAAGITGKPKAIAEAIAFAATVADRRSAKPLPGNMSEVVESLSAGKNIRRRLDTLLSSGVETRTVSWVKISVIVFFAFFSLFIHVPFALPPPLFSPIIQF